MAYLEPEEFRVAGKQPWTEGLLLPDVDEGYLAAVIAQAQIDVDAMLGDTFEPPNPDNDVTIDVAGRGGSRLYLPRRVRSIATVKTRDANGVLTTQASTLWRVTASTGESAPYDYLDVIPGQALAGGTGFWPRGSATVQVVGKFGWAETPADVKELAALLVYDRIKPSNDPMGRITQLSTSDATQTFGEPRRVEEIKRRYRRQFVMAA